MNQTPTAKKPNAIKSILLTGFIAGTLDAAAASINFYARTGNNPIRVWRFVASGIFGKNAYADADGLLMPALGLLFHFCLAFSFTIFFFLIYPKIKLLAKNIFVTGILYGLLVWVVMNRIVVPLSNTAKLPPRSTPTILGVSTQTILGMAFILFCIGLPIAYLTARYYRKRGLIPAGS